MYYYINNFLLYSIFGFLYENVLCLMTQKEFADNPFIGPWMPIYGFGIIVMVFLTRFVFNRLKMPRIMKIIALFLLSMIILTILEQLGGMIIEAIFHKSFWDYSNMKFNYGKYICLEVSLIWGSACLIFLYLLKPKTDKLIKKLPHFITNIVLILFLCDFIFTFFMK